MTTPEAPTAERYFELLDSDTERLIALADLAPDAQVPCCDGWLVRDVVAHVATVYAHKVRVLADGAWPDPWPPPGFEGRDDVAGFLREAKDDLFAEFASHALHEETLTFGQDKSVAFWVRRMALEAAVHRYDVELALDQTTAVPDDLAIDGIDELLVLFLGGPWWTERVQTQHPVDGVIAVEAAGRRWLCDVREKSVQVSAGGSAGTSSAAGGDPPDVRGGVTGSAAAVFLWLWGRVGDGAVEASGDPESVAEFRQRIVECTG